MKSSLTDILQIGRTYSGAEINAAGLGWMVKLTNADERHNNVQFQTGVNTDPISFAPLGQCSAGGMYFCRAQDAGRFFQYGSQNMCFVRNVTLPDNARVYVEKHKMKTDVFVLGPRAPIAEHAELLHVLATAGVRFIPTFFDNALFTEDVLRAMTGHHNREMYLTMSGWGDAPPRLLIDKFLVEAAADGYLVPDLPPLYRTRAVMDAAIKSQCYSYAGIASYFPCALKAALASGDIDKRALALLGARIDDFSERTHDLLLQLAQSIHGHQYDLRDIFDPALFTPEVYAHLACNPNYPFSLFSRIPKVHLTSEVLHRLVHAERKGVAFKYRKSRIAGRAAEFPPEAFTQAICDRLVLTLHAFPEIIPPVFRTRALFDAILRSGIILNGLRHFDEAFVDADALVLLCASLASGVQQYISSCAPDRIRRSRDVLAVVIKKRYWNEIGRFHDDAFDQALCTQLVGDGFLSENDMRSIPEKYRTLDMYLEARRVNPNVAIPPHLTSQWEAHVLQDAPKRDIRKTRKRRPDWARK